jgi:hypothetical protein
MKTKAWLKGIGAAGVGAAALLAGGAVRMAVSQTGSGDKATAQEIAAKSRGAYAALSSYSDSGTVVSEMAGQKITLTFNTRLQRPKRYRIDWAQGMGPKGTVWSDGGGDYLLAAAAGQEKNAKPQKLPSMETALAQAAGLSWSAASTIPGAFFNQDINGAVFAFARLGRNPLKRENDAKVGDVDCYVVSGVVDLSKLPEQGKSGTASAMFWIGKSDFLIHQCRTRYVEKAESSAPPGDQAIDEAIKKALEMQHKPATPEAIAAMRPQMSAVMRQVQSTLKSSFESGIVFTQTHENIVVNEKLTPADFTP